METHLFPTSNRILHAGNTVSDGKSTDQIHTLAASKNTKSGMTFAMVAITARATPGKIYALFPWPVRNSLPLNFTGGKGEPDANTQRP